MGFEQVANILQEVERIFQMLDYLDSCNQVI
jgi:hypothetical protein